MVREMSPYPLVIFVLLLCHTGHSLGSGYNPATHHPAPPATNDCVGTEGTLGGLDVYISGSPSASAAVIMISDVFGWKMPLFRKLADKVAKHGYYVVAPDYFNGDPLIDLADFPAWYTRHLPSAAVETTNKMVIAVKAKGISTVGVAGFCWGGKVVALVGKQKGLVSAIVQLHPGLVEASDFQEVVVPIMSLAAPEDGVQNFTSILQERKQEVDSYVKVFKGVVHGWTIRYDETNATQVKNANHAHKLMLKWFRKYLF